MPESAARRRKENAAAERRKARGRAFPAVISGDPEMGVTVRRATGAAFRTSACRRSAPLTFFGERKTHQGAPAPSSTGGGALAMKKDVARMKRSAIRDHKEDPALRLAP